MAPTATAVRVPPAVRNVLANWAGYFVVIVVNFFLSPLIVNHLGSTGYGVWALLATLTGYLGLLDLGVRTTVTRYVAQSQGGAEDATAMQSVSTALGLFLGLAIFAVLVSAMLGVWAPWFLTIPPEYRHATLVVAILTGASTALALLTGVFGGVIVGMQRFDLARGLETGTALLRAGLVLAVILTGGGLVKLALAHLVSSMVGGVVTAWATRRLYPAVPLRPSWQPAHLRVMFSFGGYAFTAHMANAIIDRSAFVVIGAFQPVSAVTLFAIASTLAEQVHALAAGIRTTLYPVASALELRGDRRALAELAMRGARYSSMLIIPIVATFVIRGTPFIDLWMGSAYGGPAGQVLAVLALRLVFVGPTAAVSNVFLSAGRHRSVAALFLAQAVVSLITVTAFVRYFGVLGAAWGLTIPAVAVALTVWPVYARRWYGVGLRRYVLVSWLLPMLAAVPFVAATVAVERLWPASSLALFFAQTALLVPVVLVMFWRLCVTDGERLGYLGLLRAAASKLPLPSGERDR